jgi:anti-anti-sigma factor
VSALEVRHDLADGSATIRLAGELDISTAADVERLLTELESGSPARIVIDLRALQFMDSTGLRLLVTADLRLRRDGRELVLVPGPEPVHRVFRLALLEERLTFVDATPGAGDDGGDG